MANVRMRHPDIDDEIDVPSEESAEVFKLSGWKVVDDKPKSDEKKETKQ